MTSALRLVVPLGAGVGMAVLDFGPAAGSARKCNVVSYQSPTYSACCCLISYADYTSSRLFRKLVTG